MSEHDASRWTRWAPRLLLTLAALLALGWALYLLAGEAIAGVLADRLGGAVRSVTDGKIRDARPFALHRLRDVLVIGTAFVALWGLNRFAVPRLSEGRWSWIPLGVLFFAEANVFMAVLAKTGLFWLAMYAGDAGRTDVTRFYVREAIAADAPMEPLVAIIGSSQAGTQVDEDLINEHLGDRLYAAQMNFPGAKPYSLLLLQDEFEEAGADAMVLYLSEVSFLRGATLEHLPLFASLRGMRDFSALDGDPEWDPDRIRNGWLSSVLPIYRLRSVLAQRVLGKNTRPAPPQPTPAVVDGNVAPPEASGDDAEADEALDNPKQGGGAADVNDPAFRANVERRVELLILGETVDFQYRALDAFARRADEAGIDLYLLPGTLHPALAERLPPDARPTMLAFLRDLGERYERVHYVEEDRLPVLGPDDFKDAAHGSKQGQARFTQGLIPVLREEILGETAPQPLAPEASGDAAPDEAAPDAAAPDGAPPEPTTPRR